MPKLAYPDSHDCERVLRSLGLFDADALDAAILDLDLETAASAASRQWEEETGWIPFLADAAAVTRFFDPQGPNRQPQVVGGRYVMELGTGLVTLTSVTNGIGPTSVGTLQTLDTDFWLSPYNADELGRPWTALEWLVQQWGARRSIKIIGRFGYSTTVPDDAWLAIAHRAASIALPEIATRIVGGVRKFSEAGVTEEYGDDFLTGQKGVGGAWSLEWKAAVGRYRRIVL
jgi:hypothetical protein